MLRGVAIRAFSRANTASIAAVSLRGPSGAYQARTVVTAVSKPTLTNIEKRWEGMPPEEQAELWMALRDRMKGPWSEMTEQEKKSCKSH